MKYLPIGIQTFRDLIGQNYLYIDKTEMIHRLLAGGGKYYFISRPRRFGKSLLISTLYEMFSGNRELFKGLWIEDKIDWGQYPVIHLDFTQIGFQTPETLALELSLKLDRIAGGHGLTLDQRRDYKGRLEELIERLSARGRVVLLIDEYDKPIIDHIDRPGIALENRDILRNFYSTIKGSDGYLKFVFLTGVSKFSRVSIFSGLNNLRDITMSTEFASMFGYTQAEIEYYFADRIDGLSQKLGIGRESLLANIKSWYNGYSWDGVNFLYNPFSVLSFFQEGKFGNYWFSTGTPGFLLKALTAQKIDFKKLDCYRAGEAFFESFELDRLNVPSLLFQTGYLTVKEIEHIDIGQRLYTLSYPNVEVKRSFLEHLLGYLSKKQADEIGVIGHELKRSLIAGDFASFFERLAAIFASIPYNMIGKDKEAYFHSIFYVILTLLGINTRCEVQTNKGRIDAEVEIDDHIFIMEFKMGSAAEALGQIKEKKYDEKYRGSDKRITLVGIGFSLKERNISGFLVEGL